MKEGFLNLFVSILVAVVALLMVLSMTTSVGGLWAEYFLRYLPHAGLLLLIGLFFVEGVIRYVAILLIVGIAAMLAMPFTSKDFSKEDSKRISYNVMYVDLGTENLNQNGEVDNIAQVKPDILITGSANSSNFTEIKRIRKLFRSVPCSNIGKNDESLIVFSNVPLQCKMIKQGNYAFAHLLLKNDRALFAVKAPKPVNSETYEERNAYFEALAAYIAKNNKNEKVVIGTFNAPPYSSALKTFASGDLDLVSSTQYFKPTNYPEMTRLDFAFMRQSEILSQGAILPHVGNNAAQTVLFY